MSNYHIYGVGAALVDTEIEVKDEDLHNLSIEKGVMTLVDEQRQHELIDTLSDHLIASKRASGGSAANTVIAASYFGAKTFYSCKVANDENGAFYLNDMDAAGVMTPPGSGQETGITGKCLVMITPDAERSMNTFLGVSESLSVNELHEPALKQSEYAYIEGYLVTSETGRSAAIQLRQWAEAHGVKVAMSLSDPAIVEFFKDGLKEMIGERIDLLFCNEAEALNFTDASSIDEAVTRLKSVANQFAITRGKSGSIVFDGNELITVAAHPVEAIDTNGAGDMFAGAFLYGITHGFSFDQAGQLASRAAAKVVSQFGPRLHPDQHQQIIEAVNSQS